jgi:cytochrome c
MDLFQLNKVAGAVLGTLLFVQVVALTSDAIFSHQKPAQPGYNLPSAAETASPEGKAAPELPLPELLAKADPKKGEDDTKPCQACHNFEKGAGVKIGPPLYGVVGRPRASVPGFDYSAAMKAKGGTWTFDEIFKFIKDPQSYIPGTKMTFSGEPDPQKRADIIAYLRTLSDNPIPLPKVTAPAASAAQPAAKPAAPAAKPAGAPAAAAPASAAPAPAAPAATPPAPAAKPPAAAPATAAPATTPPSAPAAPAATPPAPSK